MKKTGFSLVEIMVVVAVLGIVGTILTDSFLRSIKASNKSQLIASLNQNGKTVLEVMDKTIRGAEKVACPTTTSNSDTLVIRKSDGTLIRYRFFTPSSSVNGQIKQDNPTVPLDNPALFYSRLCIETQNPDALTLTNTDLAKGVSVESGSFKLSLSPGFRELVTINFNLNTAVNSPLEGQIDAVPFSTTVELR